MREDKMRLVDASKLDEDVEDITFRPKNLVEFIGQTHLKEELELYIQSTKIRNSVLEHVLLSGPPGLGKTTVANIIANELGHNIISLTGPSIKKLDEIIEILLDLNRGDILFIDEIHGLSKVIEEILYPAMEDYNLPLTKIKRDKEGKEKKEPFNVSLKPFTLIGATTRAGMLANPFRDRFGIFLRFELYSTEELVDIIRRTSSLLGVPITPEGVIEIAKRSRGTPRIANRLTRRVRDVMIVKGDIEVNKKIAEKAFSIMRIDEFGLDDLDRQIIFNIYTYYGNRPVGIKTIAQSVGEDIRTIEEVYEPYLVHIGFLKKTASGREVTKRALEHMSKISGKYKIRDNKDNKKEIKKVSGMPLLDSDDIK